MRAVRVETTWTVERADSVSRVACAIALMLDEDTDEGSYETRLSLNGDLFYQRAFDTWNDAAGHAGETLRSLLAAGWRQDVSAVSMPGARRVGAGPETARRRLWGVHEGTTDS